MIKNSSKPQPLTVAIIGASGFVGQHLLRVLLETTNHSVRAICRHPELISFDAKYQDRVHLLSSDIFNSSSLREHLEGADVAVYLVHMMARGGDYYKYETEAAHGFAEAARTVHLPRVVYMSGLGDDNEKLSRHLSSRHHTGEILQNAAPEVIELRASMIVGEGSIAYDIARTFVRKLPVQALPTWANTKTQPIALTDALRYLDASLTVPMEKNEIVEIGGPEVMFYADLIAKYAYFIGKKPKIIFVPAVPVWLGAGMLNVLMPRRHARIGRQMAESLANAMVVTNDRARVLFPEITPTPIERAFT